MQLSQNAIDMKNQWLKEDPEILELVEEPENNRVINALAQVLADTNIILPAVPNID